jgi:hypothetical protein
MSFSLYENVLLVPYVTCKRFQWSAFPLVSIRGGVCRLSGGIIAWGWNLYSLSISTLCIDVYVGPDCDRAPVYKYLIFFNKKKVPYVTLCIKSGPQLFLITAQISCCYLSIPHTDALSPRPGAGSSYLL